MRWPVCASLGVRAMPRAGHRCPRMPAACGPRPFVGRIGPICHARHTERTAAQDLKTIEGNRIFRLRSVAAPWGHPRSR